MRFGYREICLEHDTGARHPESPDRLRAIRETLSECDNVEYVAPDSATEEEVSTVHDADYVSEVHEFCAEGGGNWDTDTVAVKETWDAVMASAGLAQWAARAALDSTSGNEVPFALGRPPGHHAVEDDAMGFCFINNVAVAAQHVIDRELADRVAILDWDVHHGNGTQDMFYDREDVFYVSFHEEGLYPGTGGIGETGEGDAELTTLNAPFPAGCGDAEYMATLEEVVGPSLESFDPDLLLVSAGFDAHEHDPISRMVVTTDGYGLMTDFLWGLTEQVDAGLGFVLEGGYGLETLSDGVKMVHEVFDGHEPPTREWSVNDNGRSVIANLKEQGFPSIDPGD